MEVLMIVNIVLGVLGGIVKGIAGVIKFGAKVAYKGVTAVGKGVKFLYEAGKSTEPSNSHKECKHTCEHTHNTSRLDTFK